ncbi:beta-N-acetylhexosaminidase [Aeromicrobium panaciterrae]|uniref:beta-N-acetylhexosaminidase n=1 Tax=Aeromicrobium panaciterrae TaxID=363861 RepID=A0ABU1URA4_9ACTN|nr:glycoside hydrolase family 3 N-terminal domain-containing protein [Aeromicrobium panaciterrae]MDR7087720.1 beta-N-acetylhexosaminidase [Aeromicrobium panaciterrae]
MPSHRASHRAPRKSHWRRNLSVALSVVIIGGTAVWWLSRADPIETPVATTSDAASTTSPSATKKAMKWSPTSIESAAAKTLANDLSLEDLAGQLIIARHRNNAASLALVRDKHFAGVMVTSPQILDVSTNDPLSQIKAFNADIQEAGGERDYPVMVPVDQEGGLVTRLKRPMTPFPTFMSAGAAIAGDPKQGAQAVAGATKASGAELRAAGFNTVFAPIGDVTIGAADPIIGTRSAGTDPAIVAKSVVAAVTGYSQAGLISAVKHFPGHNVSADSHSALPLLASDKKRLADHDLVPFKSAIAAGAPSIMTGHLNVSSIDPGVPASMSRKVITGVLRKELGYDGLVVSDSLGMGAVVKRYPGGEAAVQAIKAGSDLALMPADNDRAYLAVLAALKSGEIPEKQARASVARVIAHLLHADAAPQLNGDAGSHAIESQALSAAAITMVSEVCGASDPVTAVRPSGSSAAVANFKAAAKEAGLSTSGGSSLAFTSSRSAYADIVVSTDRPYALANSTAPTKIALYGTELPAMRALVAVLTGKAEARGKLPVDGIAVKQC